MQCGSPNTHLVGRLTLLRDVVLVYGMTSFRDLCVGLIILLFGPIWHKPYPRYLLLLCYQITFEASALKQFITRKLQQTGRTKAKQGPSDIGFI